MAAVLAEASKWAFGLYVSQALPYLKLYGAIGLMPLFLFWLYLSWLIVLFGLEIAFTLQAMKGRVFEREEPRRPRGRRPPVAAAGDGGARAARRGRPAGEPPGSSPRTSTCGSRRWPSSLRASRPRVSCTRSRARVRDVGLTLALPPERIPLARLLELASRSTLGTRAARRAPGWDALSPRSCAQRAAPPAEPGRSPTCS